MKNRRLITITCMALALLLVTAAGCGMKASYDQGEYYSQTSPAYYNDYAYEAEDVYYAKTDSNYYSKDDYYEEPATTMAASDSGNTDGSATTFVRKSNDKLVYTCTMSLETLEFEKSIASIKALINEFDGFIENESQTDSSSNWYYSDYVKTRASMIESIVIRIPTEHYDDFVNAVSGTGKVTSKNQNVQNITTVYNDTATTIESLKTQEKRLLKMMEEANTIEEMLQIEDRLSEVQNELKHYENRLAGYDTDVAYSTITMKVVEVLEYTPDPAGHKVSTFRDRLKNTLEDSWDNFTGFLEDLLFFLIRALPILIVVGGIIFLIVWAIVRAVKRSNRRSAEKAAKKAAKKAAAGQSGVVYIDPKAEKQAAEQGEKTE